jgi:beta-mannanase
MFGHQDALAYGIGWKDIKGESDVKRLIGQHPAVFGWEIGNIELDSISNLDNVSFEKMREYIRMVYDMGGINTLSWHANNPLTGKTAWDVSPGTVSSILPGGIKHDLFVNWLNRVADFLASLKASDGEPMPILFRPWHELTGNWFWWCQNVCSPEEFRLLWKFTYEHLVIKRRLGHLIWVYNTAEFSDGNHFLERLPDRGMVDILSFDTYQHPNSINNGVNYYVKNTGRMLNILDSLGRIMNMPVALAETGYETIPKADWWTNDLLPLIKKYYPAYVLCWRNAGIRKDSDKMHYYVPFKGDMSAQDFIEFSKDPGIIFQKQIKRLNIYDY